MRTGNLVYALFEHDTSRALDPQGHVHAVIANLTQMPDGKWQALHNRAIWKSQQRHWHHPIMPPYAMSWASLATRPR
nr:relaxase domain-containing protein [Sphingobium sp. EP60837]